MKKLVTLFTATVCSLAMMATTYNGTLSVDVNGETTALTGVNINVNQNGSNYDLNINNFALGEGMNVGNIALTNVPAATKDDVKVMAVNRKINITAGDDPSVATWYGPMLGEVPIKMIARFTDDYLAVDIDIEMAELNQTIKVSFTNDTEGTYAASFQIPNGDFETWSDNIKEPRHWHDFNSAKGSWASSPPKTIAKSEGRPASSGSYSATVHSESVLWVVANGTITTGQLNAGAMSASDPANHSEMSESSTETDNWGDKFYTPLKADPDAINFWMKFTASQQTAKANLSAVAFDGSYYQEPVDKNYNGVIRCKAQNSAIAPAGWTEYNIPFDYADAYKGSAKAMLITASTSATPGGGKAGDQIWLDDLSLVYNAKITGIQYNGVPFLTDFQFNADKHHDSYEYEGNAAEITADNFNVTVDGHSAILIKNVEALGHGEYNVAIGVATPDLKVVDLYTYTIYRKVDAMTGDIFILGEVNGNDWDSAVGVEMTPDEDKTVYTAQVTTTKNEGNFFSFTTKLADPESTDGWEDIYFYRFGAEPGDGNFWITDELLGTQLKLGEIATQRAFRLPAGEWTFTLNTDQNTLVVTPVVTVKDIYIMGEVDQNNNVWATNVGLKMDTEDDNTYTAHVTTSKTVGNYFSFTHKLAETADDWDGILPYRFGAEPGEGDFWITEALLGATLNLGQQGTTRAFRLEAGEWDLTLDLNARTLVVTAPATVKLGDVNLDGKVDIADLNIIANIILGLDNAANYGTRAYINDDDRVDIADLNIVANIILGLPY